MPFIKPPFYQGTGNARPAASRGLSADGSGPPPPYLLTILSNVIDGGQVCQMWYDYTLPEDYVPGTGLTLTLDMMLNEVAARRMWAAGITSDDGPVGDAVYTTGWPGPANAQAAAFQIGTVVVPFCAADEADGSALVPSVRAYVDFQINGENRNDDGWALLAPGVPNTGSGGVTVTDSAVFPQAPAGFPLDQIIPGGRSVPYIWFDIMKGGIAPSAGPAPGTIQYGPGDRITIFVKAQATAQLIDIYSSSLDCGNGRPDAIPLTSWQVLDPNSLPVGQPRPVSFSQLGANNIRPFRLRIIAVSDAPINVTPPVIEGDPTVGQTLSLVSVGTWLGNPTSYRRQWKANGVAISGRTGTSLFLTSALDGKTITCQVTARSPYGQGSADSNPLGPVVTPLPPGNYRITAGGDYRITADGDYRIWVEPAPPVTVVHNTAELVAALNAAAPGDTIACGAGDVFSGWNPDNLSFDPAVNIVADNPAIPPLFQNFSMNNSRGFHFSDIEFDGQDPTYNAFVWADCTDLQFDGCDIHGPDPAMSTTMTVFQFLRCDQVGIFDGEIHHAARGATFGVCSNITVERVDFHDCTNDLTDIAQVTNCAYRECWFRNLFPPVGAHPDNAQGYTTGTTASSQNVLFDSCLVELGAGQPAQGLFGGDESGGLKPWINVTFNQNMINGQGGNRALSWNRGQNVIVDGCELVRWTGGINVNMLMQNNVGLTLTNNRTSSAIGTGGSTEVVSSGNITNEATVGDMGAARVAAWRALHPGVPS